MTRREVEAHVARVQLKTAERYRLSRVALDRGEHREAVKAQEHAAFVAGVGRAMLAQVGVA